MATHDRPLAELTLRSIIAGILVGILFGAANAYLGLRVGLTVSASIPAAVMSITIFRALSRLRLGRDATLLENNMVQTIGSAGESLAAGVIFTIPALILLGFDPGVLMIFIYGAVGGTLGVLFMIPLRQYLIVRERETLGYPEGKACAAVLEAGQAGGNQGRLVIGGLAFGAVYEALVSGAGLWKSAPAWRPKFFPGAEVSADASPALLGVGYVVGPRIAAIMFGGGAIAWLALIPAISLFGGHAPEPIFPAKVPISALDAHGIWTSYVRYIGAGAVVFGGFITLIRSLPVIWQSGRAALAGLRQRVAPTADRTEQDLSGKFILGAVALITIVLLALPQSLMPGGAPAVLLALVFSFFFVAVSSRIVGLVGSSSNPISGMTIAALLATTLIFKILRLTGPDHQAAAIAVGAIVCIAAAIAGDVSQDLKTGYLVRATPWKQQVGEIAGVLTSAAVVGFVLLRLDKAYGFGSEALPAPQATLMSMVVKGVFSGDLPWGLVLVGISIAGVVELLGIPALPFAVGLYLPFSLSAAVFVGGMVRALVEHKWKKPACAAGPEPEPGADRGVLFASGLIAGSAFIGMAVGMLKSIGESPAGSACLAQSGWWSCWFSAPGGVASEFFRRLPLWMEVGPTWAGDYQDPLAWVIVAGLAGLLWWVSRERR